MKKQGTALNVTEPENMEKNTNRLEEIENKLAELKKALSEVEGTKCEVCARITGHYQPLGNWNRGKSEEYKERKVYDIS